MKKKLSVSEQLGALIYYGDKVGMSWDDLTEEEQKLWYTRGANCLEALDKMEFAILPKTQVIQDHKNRANELDLLTQFIQSFVNKLKIVNKANLFPSGELAHKIINDFRQGGDATRRESVAKIQGSAPLA